MLSHGLNIVSRIATQRVTRLATRHLKITFCIFLLTISACETTKNIDQWNDTIEKVSSGVVNIQVDTPVHFDGGRNRSRQATGFIVDAKRGIILTNRHVISPGPVTAKAILINNEEIELKPLYFDPVHDFGFLSYDPNDIKHLVPHEFKLNAKDVSLGQEIRIIGNDAGQKISILDGTISRLDRPAPNYGRGKYNDFNTFYIQATTASTGGSSGSPVINARGDAVALNAGSSSRSSTAFYLPLDKVKHTLSRLQNEEAIHRGTLKTTFMLTPFDKLKRLGLSSELESQFRIEHANNKGLLVVDSVLPNSENTPTLEVGDILLSVEKSLVTDFNTLSEIIDRNIDDAVDIEVLREGNRINLSVNVDNLHNLTPSSYLKFDDCIFHDLSYQQGRHFFRELNGVYVASSTASFEQAGIPDKAVIISFNGNAISNLADFKKQLEQSYEGDKVHIRYITLNNPQQSRYALVEIKYRWFEAAICEKDVEAGYWPCTPIKQPLRKALAKTHKPLEHSISNTVSQDIRKSLVQVDFNSPYSIQGRVSSSSRYGTGLIVDAEKGLVIVDRSVVFSLLGDVKLVFNNQLELPGKVEYIHPLHNLSLISFPPEKLGNIKVQSAKIANTPLKKGDEVTQAGLNYDGELEYRTTSVDLIDELWMTPFNIPQYIDENIDTINLRDGNYSIDGVILNEDGEVGGIWSTFEGANDNGKDLDSVLAGIPAEFIIETLELATSQSNLRTLDISLTYIPPVQALEAGLPQKFLKSILGVNPDNQKLLGVTGVSGIISDGHRLQRGDLILAIDDMPVSSFRQLEKLSQKPNVKVTYLREGKVLTNNMETAVVNGKDIERILFWSGLSLHQPHRAVQLQKNIDDKGIYIASYRYGSPANRYGIFAMRRIIEVDGKPTQDLDELIANLKDKQHNDPVVLKTLDLNNKTDVISLLVDEHNWPFYEVKYIDGEWSKVFH